MTVDELKKAVIEYEKKLFYEKTNFGESTGYWTLDFSMPGLYDTIYNHILVHKYYLNEKREEELSFESALLSWFCNVYKPIIGIITVEDLCGLFPGRTSSDLYVWIVKHWDTLKKIYGIEYTIADAAKDFGSRYGSVKRGLPVFFRSIFGGIIDGILGKTERGE
jgi:hypothetical protein